ncbi:MULTISPECIES: peptidoglycan DD-metalloendopeptidase family protein [unclassified Neptuniibacter]|uniref:murein hydrolase activator EnvC family protein n=1 Tax=unclassified Neptuniibacter TaxID=2630693 RepID=UPI000C379427|nr:MULTISPECIES: peptidoglycan DD-metalloendopeptidase family protein [unclassified Neptuniibacter]MAY42143.1 peptidase M23 [Oceanospirillaceae bacterium]|tara:strand:- start:22679 stop:23824 length:1146 start_codon:yes stop_codon:yes gene_type:complete
MLRICVFVVVIVCSGLTPSWLLAADKQALTEKQVKALSSRISSLQKNMQKQEGVSRQLSSELKRSEVAIGKLARQIQLLDKQLTGLGTHAEDLEVKRDALKAELKKRAALIEKQISQQYKMGNQARLQLLLTQRDPETLDRVIRYYDFVNAELRNDMQQFQDKLSQLTGTERELTDTEQRMVIKRDELSKEVAALRLSRNERKNTLTQLRKTLSTDKTKLKQLQLDQKRLQAVLKEIEKSLNFATLVKDDKKFSLLKGKLPWPIKGKVKQTFGSVTNNISYDGIWITAREAASVKAVHHGRVVFSDWLRGYGLVLIIDHGSGYMSLYGYNQSLLLETGDWVSAGDTVATVGSSGGRDVNGLYFAVRYKGKPSNPSRWLSRK